MVKAHPSPVWSEYRSPLALRIMKGSFWLDFQQNLVILIVGRFPAKSALILSGLRYVLDADDPTTAETFEYTWCPAFGLSDGAIPSPCGFPDELKQNFEALAK